MVKEITIELTNFCPHTCKFCSSETMTDQDTATFISYERVKFLLSERYDRIILSGGEPLSHPHFYSILELCKRWSGDVVVYTNALNHIAYNAHVLDGIYIETAVTIPDSVQEVRLLKRVAQGRGRTRPEVTFSRNFDGTCPTTCDNVVVRPDGRLVVSPCRKDESR